MGATTNPTLRFADSTDVPDLSIHTMNLAVDTKAAFNALGVATNYTPGWWVPAAISLGNGSVWGKYVQLGDLVFFSSIFQRGTTTGLGSGTYEFGLPPISHGAWMSVHATGTVLHDGSYYPVQASGSASGRYKLYRDNGAVINQFPPSGGSWSTGGTISVNGWFIRGM